jgi:hypothetical protein
MRTYLIQNVRLIGRPQSNIAADGVHLGARQLIHGGHVFPLLGRAPNRRFGTTPSQAVDSPPISSDVKALGTQETAGFWGSTPSGPPGGGAHKDGFAETGSASGIDPLDPPETRLKSCGSRPARAVPGRGAVQRSALRPDEAA